MITDRKVPYANGVSTMVINGGNMTNSGWDLGLSVIPIRTKNFLWSLGMNTSKVYNKLKSSLEPTGDWKEAVSGQLNKEGYALSSFWAFKFIGLNPENGAPKFDLTDKLFQYSDVQKLFLLQYLQNQQLGYYLPLLNDFRTFQ